MNWDEQIINGRVAICTLNGWFDYTGNKYTVPIQFPQKFVGLPKVFTASQATTIFLAPNISSVSSTGFNMGFARCDGTNGSPNASIYCNILVMGVLAD